jgi:hypothetical protein
VHATLLEAIARPSPPHGGSGPSESAFLAIFHELPLELRFDLSELVARRAAMALVIGCGGDLVGDAPVHRCRPVAR